MTLSTDQATAARRHIEAAIRAIAATPHVVVTDRDRRDAETIGVVLRELRACHDDLTDLITKGRAR